MRDSRGNLLPGATSRVAEYLGKHHGTIRSWVDGERIPRDVEIVRVKTMLADKALDLSAKQTGFAPGKKTWIQAGKRRIYRAVY